MESSQEQFIKYMYANIYWSLSLIRINNRLKNFKLFKLLYRNDSNNLSYKSKTFLQFYRFREYLFEIAV